MAMPITKIRSVNGVPLPPNMTCGDPACSAYRTTPYVLTRSQYGVGCLGNVGPGGTPNPQPPPESYAAADIGKPGFPELAPPELDAVRRIERYVHSKTLRIAWLAPPNQRVNAEFIVFDATDGPCLDAAPGYPVLNGSCNEFYEPGENPYNTGAAPDCFRPSPRPWMTSR
jgi:hypothetical protein